MAALRDGEPEKLLGDTRFRLLGALAIPVYLLAMYVPIAQDFFELKPLGALDWGLVVLVAGAGYGLSLLSDLWRWDGARVRSPRPADEGATPS